MSGLQLPSRDVVLLDDHRPARRHPVGLRLYVAGPMTGIPGFNRMAFVRAAAMLRDAGFTVENPATNPEPANPVWENWMRIAIPQMLTCDGVALLEGWENSEGAKLEVMVAHKLNMPIGMVDGWLA